MGSRPNAEQLSVGRAIGVLFVSDHVGPVGEDPIEDAPND
jgi:hypothetical protein